MSEMNPLKLSDMDSKVMIAIRNHGLSSATLLERFGTSSSLSLRKLSKAGYVEVAYGLYFLSEAVQRNFPTRR